MFCNQCEETVKGTGCTIKGVCGKEEETAGLQDVLVYLCKGIAERNIPALAKGTGDKTAAAFIAEALFATLTNTNFDSGRIRDLIAKAVTIRNSLPKTGAEEPDACTWIPENEADIAAKEQELPLFDDVSHDVFVHVDREEKHRRRDIIIAFFDGPKDTMATTDNNL